MSVLLAKTWAGTDPAGWWLSEKLDGVRAVWDCRQLRTRTGQVLHAPQWFLDTLPQAEPLDGELWMGRGRFQDTVSVVRSHDAGKAWRQIRYAAFDAPLALGGFEDRLAAMRDALAGDGQAYVFRRGVRGPLPPLEKCKARKIFVKIDIFCQVFLKF